MKTWSTPVVEEINFTETQYGSYVRTTVDKTWNDENGEPVYAWS